MCNVKGSERKCRFSGGGLFLVSSLSIDCTLSLLAMMAVSAASEPLFDFSAAEMVPLLFRCHILQQ